VHTLTVWPVAAPFKPARRRGLRLKWVDLLRPVGTARRVEVRQGLRVRRGRVTKGPVEVTDCLDWTDMLAGVE
jgi:hypothetical protein